MQNPLSSNLALAALFLLSLAPHAQYDAQLTPISMTKSSPPQARLAFTLIELLVVIAAIGILLGIAVPALSGAYERAKVTKDLSNLRQIGAATQMYMNDNNGVFPGSATLKWMSQLEQNQKYLSSWRVLESPFDRRTTSELGDSTTAVSYGINANVLPGNVAISADKITKPVTFIVFAPAQAAGPTVSFQGAGDSAAPGVTVLAATSTPGGGAAGGPHNNRAKINALFADWHAETMLWSGTGPAFTNNTATGTDPDGELRWKPYTPFP
jgi:prepilin-type N-terminal cleavage/methylation domain-containing protein/prepilin-type processing-associated H-X9-DG protein